MKFATKNARNSEYARIGDSMMTKAQTEAVAEPVEQLIERQHRDSCRCEFDGERHAVEANAHLCDQGAVIRIERRVGRPSPFDEQLHRGTTVVGAERRDLVYVLERDVEPLARRRQDLRRSPLREDRFDQLRACVDDVLTVVEHDQHRLATDEPCDPVSGVASLDLQPDAARHLGRHVLVGGGPGEVDEPHTVVPVG